MNQTHARWLLRHGFVLLLVAFTAGFGIIPGGKPARGWMAVHLTTMLNGGFAVLVGLAWERLVLTPRKRRVLRWAVVGNGYWAALAGLFAVVFGVPGPVSGGGAQPAGWTAAVFFSVFIPVITVLPFIFAGLTVYGLRESAVRASERDLSNVA